MSYSIVYSYTEEFDIKCEKTAMRIYDLYISKKLHCTKTIELLRLLGILKSMVNNE